MFQINWLVVISIIFTLISISFASKSNEKNSNSNKKLNAIETFDKSKINESKFNSSQSPVIINYQVTKNLLLDFDSFNDASNFVSLMFPEDSSIFNDLSWQLPLYDSGKLQNVFKLKEYIDRVRCELSIELFNHDLNSNWISSFNKVTDYVNVILTSFYEFGYLAARIEKTDNFIGKELLYTSIKDHLKVLADFSSDLINRSGQFGVILPLEYLSEPSKYFVNFLNLQENAKIGLSDKNSVEFVEFFFEVYGGKYEEVLFKLLIDNIQSDRWIPLPIYYLRNRLARNSLARLNDFIGLWIEKAFTGEYFDTRHFKDLGRLLQQSMMSLNELKRVMQKCRDYNLKRTFKFDEHLISFLTFLSSTPWLLHSDPQIALLIGDFSSPFLFRAENVINSDEEKVKLINEIWSFFAGAADFSFISDVEYNSLCALIYRIDLMYPGISEILWGNIQGSSLTRLKSFDVFDEFNAKVLNYRKLENFEQRYLYLEANFSIEQTFGEDLIDCKTFYVVFEFMTDVLVDTFEIINKSADDEFFTKIISHCIKFFEIFLLRNYSNSLYSYWYSEHEFIPFRLFDVLNDLWFDDKNGDSLRTSTICNHITRLVDYHKEYARKFLIMLATKTLYFKSPAFDGKILTPKCLTLEETDPIYFEYFTSILSLKPEGQIFNSIFLELTEKLFLESISLESASKIFQIIFEIKNAAVELKSSEFCSFFNPNLIINLIKRQQLGVDEDNYNALERIFYFYLMLFSEKNLTDEISTNLLQSLSNFTGLYDFVKGKINDNVDLLDNSILNYLTLSENNSAEDIENGAISMFYVYLVFVTKGLRSSDVYLVFDKLVKIAKKVRIDGTKYGEFSDLTLAYAFDCLLLVILRSEGFKMEDEGKVIKNIYSFYLYFYNSMPRVVENLAINLREQISFINLYGKIIESKKPLPANAFDFPILTERRLVVSIQNLYIKMFAENVENIEQLMFAPIIGWIQKGQMDINVLLKLFALVNDEMSVITFSNFLPIIHEFIKSTLYSEFSKYLFLKDLFSPKNNNLINSLSSKRLLLMHLELLEIMSINCEAVNRFLSEEIGSDWFKALKIILIRFNESKMNLSDCSHASANLFFEASVLSKKMSELVKMPVPDILDRNQIICRIDAILNSFASTLPALFDRNEAVELFFNNLISVAWNIADNAGSFFKINVQTTSFAVLFWAVSEVFKNDFRRNDLINRLLSTSRSCVTNDTILKSIPLLMSTDCMAVNYSNLKIIKSWLTNDLNETFEGFLQNLILVVIEKAQESSELEESTVLRDVILLINDVISDKNESFANNLGYHTEILIELLKVERVDLIDSCSWEILTYLKSLVFNFIDPSLLDLTIDFMKKHVAIIFIGHNEIWQLIWSKLQSLMPEKFEKPSEIKVLLNMNNYDIEIWKTLYSYIPSARISNRILFEIIGEIIEKGNGSIIIFGLISSNISIKNDFKTSKDIEYFFKILSRVVELLESDEYDGYYYYLDHIAFKKLIEWMDVEAQIRGNINITFDKDVYENYEVIWTWNQIFLFITNSQSHESKNDLNLIKTLTQALLCEFPNLLKNSTDKDSILLFIYELNYFKIEKIDLIAEIELLQIMAGEIYDLHSKTKTSVISEDSILYVQNFVDSVQKFKLIVPKFEMLTNESLIQTIKTLQAFKNGIQTFNSFKRNDVIFFNFYGFIFEITNQINSQNLEAIKIEKNVLSEFCDCVVELLFESDVLKNEISFAKVLKKNFIESFVKIIGMYVNTQKKEFKEILKVIQKFALNDLADVLFRQFFNLNIRTDVCYFTSEIIGKFYNILDDAAFFGTGLYVWAKNYLIILNKKSSNNLDNLSNSNSDVISSTNIDPLHFKMFELLLAEYEEEETVPFYIIFDLLGKIIESHPQNTFDVLNVIENLFEDYGGGKGKIDSRIFLDSTVINFFLKHPNQSKNEEFYSRILRLLKIIEKFDQMKFIDWKLSLKPNCLKFLNEMFLKDENQIKLNLHTKNALEMIKRINEVDGNDVPIIILNSFKTLEVKFIEDQVANKLGSRLIDSIMKLENEIYTREGVHFILNNFDLKKFDQETYNKLVQIANGVFNDEFFVVLVEKSANTQLLLEIFRNKINLSNLKLIRLISLANPNISSSFLNHEIILSAAKNSDPIQAMEFFQVFKTNTLSLEVKLEIFENCEYMNGYEKIGKFINYIKSISQNNSQKMEIIVTFILNNPSIMSSFEKSSRSLLKNRIAILGIIKSHLNYRTAMKFLQVQENSNENTTEDYSVKNEIGRILLKYYLKASSNSGKMISETSEIPIETLISLLNIFIAETLTGVGKRNRASRIIKCFRFYEEIETIINSKNSDKIKIYNLDPNYNLLKNLIDAMVENLNSFSVNQFISSPQSIGSVYKLLIRRLDPVLNSKLKSLRFIMKRMIFTSNIRFDLVESILNEQTKQLQSIPIDWEFINEIKDKTRHLWRIQSLIENFETLHKK